MIPPFMDNGYLPPGIHIATLEEVEARFGRESEIRRVQMQSIHWLLDIAKRAQIQRLVLNGSFVTDCFEPNDVDCVLLLGPDDTRDIDLEEELVAGLPFLQIDLVQQQEFDKMVVIFASDRTDVPKGMEEVNLWT
jgi:Family of unknown function (DUF6932)